MGLSSFAETHATELPMGAQKLLEVVRALMAQPKLLCLDEPAAGLNDTETQELAKLLRAIRKLGIPVLVVEHNMSLVMNVADRVVVIDSGAIIAAGTPSEVQNNSRVIEAYLGTRAIMPLLELKSVAIGYGHHRVLEDINLTLERGEIVTLLGANGAGKSTLAKAISGLLRPQAGSILLDGEPIEALPPAERLRRGIAHVPEGRQIFAGMTVAENLALGAYAMSEKDTASAAGDGVERCFPCCASA